MGNNSFIVFFFWQLIIWQIQNDSKQFGITLMLRFYLQFNFYFYFENDDATFTYVGDM